MTTSTLYAASVTSERSVSTIKISLRGVQSKLGTILNHYRHKFDNRILAIKKNGIHQNVLACVVRIKLCISACTLMQDWACALK